MPPATIHIPTQNNRTERSLTLPAVPECKESDGKAVLITENENPKVDQDSKENFRVANTMRAREPNTNEMDATKELLNTQLIKLRDATDAAEKQEILYQFPMEAAHCLGKSGNPAPVPSSDPSESDPTNTILNQFCRTNSVHPFQIQLSVMSPHVKLIFIQN